MRKLQKIAFALIVSISLLIINIAIGLDVSPIPTTPLAQCPYTREPITIDGNISEQAWTKAPILAPFQLISNGLYPTVQTEVRVLHDKKFLYVAYICDEPDMKSIAPNCKERDGHLWQSDVLEIFIRPPGSADYYQLALNTDAVQTDFKNGDRSWNGNWRVAVKKFPDKWTAEIAIPFSDFNFSPKIGKTFGFNVTRYRKKGYQWCSWSQTGGSFKNPSRFGELKFVKSADIIWKVKDIEKGILKNVSIEIFATPVGPSREFDIGTILYADNKPTTSLHKYRFQTKPDFSDGPQRITIPLSLAGLNDLQSIGIQIIILSRDGKILSRSGQLPVKLLQKRRLILETLSAKYKSLLSKGVPKRFSTQIKNWAKKFEYLKEHPNDDKTLKKLSHDLSLATFISKLPKSLQEADLIPFVLPIFSAKTENYIPETPNVVGKPLQITACRGESEPTSVYLLALKNFPSITLDISNLHSGKNILSAKFINAWLLKNWYQAGTSESKTNIPVLVPELLLKDDSIITVDHNKQRNILHFDPWFGPIVPDKLKPVFIPAGTNRQFWLRIDIPQNQPAGKYTGKIIIKNSGKEITKITLQVTVLPITLEDSNATFTAYNHYEYRPGAERWEKARSGPYIRVSDTFYRNLLKMCAQYGINALMIQEGIILGKSDQPVPARNEYVQKAFELRKKYGLTKITIYHGFHWSSPEAGKIWYVPAKVVADENSKISKQFLSALRELKKIYNKFRNDFPEFYIYTVDEPQGRPSVLVPLSIAVNKLVHKAGFKTAQASADPNLEGLDLMIQGGSGLPKIRRKNLCPRLIYWHPREEPLYNRRFTGIIIWYNRYMGTCPYVLANDFGSLWDDFNTKYGCRAERFIYDGKDQPIPTIQFEAYREGVDDYKYFEMLERRCQKLQKQKLNPQERKILRSAVKLINNLPDWFNPNKPESYEKLRKYSQKLLIQLEFIIHQRTKQKGNIPLTLTYNQHPVQIWRLYYE